MPLQDIGKKVQVEACLFAQHRHTGAIFQPSGLLGSALPARRVRATRVLAKASSRSRTLPVSSLQVVSDGSELLKRTLQVLYDFLRDNIRWWKVRAVFQAFVFEPEDVEVELITLS